MFRNCIRKSPSLIKQSSNICYQTKLNNFRENRSYGKEKRLESIQKFYDSTRANPSENPSENPSKFPDENIDSHDNSMYHKSLKDKNSKVHPHMNNYDYSAKALVDDFNKRWIKKIRS